MNRSYFSYRRVLYKWSFEGKTIIDGFTSQKKAMDWLKENGLKGKGYCLCAYNKDK